MNKLIEIIIDENKESKLSREELVKRYLKFMELRSLTIKTRALCSSIEPPSEDLNGALRLFKREMKRVRELEKQSSDDGVVKVIAKRKVNKVLANQLGIIGAVVKHGELICSDTVEIKNKYRAIKKLRERINGNIRDARRSNRESVRSDRRQEQTVKDYTYTLVANAHTKPNEIINAMEAKKMREVFEPKKPKTSEHHLGIELEFFCRMNKSDLGLAFYRAGLSKHVHIHGDGSIQDYPSGYEPFEINVLVKESEYKEVIKKVCEVLSQADAKVNKTCGMHVHIDARNRNKEILYANLVSAMPQLFQMNPKARREGVTGRTHYCKPNASRTFDGGMNRYHAINAAAYGEHGTIEVRLHSGTVDVTKITNWCTILVSVANTENDVEAAARTVAGFMKKFSIPAELREYIEARIAKFDSERAGNVVAEEAA